MNVSSAAMGYCRPAIRLAALMKLPVTYVFTHDSVAVGEDGEVVMGLSGGVDSSVAAVLMHRAIGKRLHCVFVDNGLLRAGEREEVEATFREHLGTALVVVDARDHVLMTCFSPDSLSASIFLSRCSSTNGPFLRLRDMRSYLPCRVSGDPCSYGGGE